MCFPSFFTHRTRSAFPQNAYVRFLVRNADGVRARARVRRSAVDLAFERRRKTRVRTCGRNEIKRKITGLRARPGWAGRVGSAQPAGSLINGMQSNVESRRYFGDCTLAGHARATLLVANCAKYPANVELHNWVLLPSRR